MKKSKDKYTCVNCFSTLYSDCRCRNVDGRCDYTRKRSGMGLITYMLSLDEGKEIKNRG